ncbi:MAG: type II CAAX endopeptidase family protein [Planctomycetota bacterium]
MRLILGLRFRRFFNRLGSFSRIRFGKNAPARKGGPAKKGMTILGAGLLMFFGLQLGTTIGWGAIQNMTNVLAPRADAAELASDSPPPEWTRTPEEWRSLSPNAREMYVDLTRKRGTTKMAETAERSRAPAVLDGVGFLLAVMMLMLLANALGVSTSDLGRLEEDVEWLLGFPVPTTAIYAAKAAERIAMNLLGWFGVAPLLTVAGLGWGAGWWSLAWGIGGALFVNALVACSQIVIEMASHRLLRPGGRRNLQAVAVVAQVGLMLGSMAYGTAAGASQSILYDALRGGSAVSRWLPGGLIAGMMHGSRGGAFTVAALAAWALGAAAFAAFAVAWASKRGLEAVQPAMGRASGRAGRRAGGQETARLDGLLGKELRLLFRDKVLLVQVALLPVVVGLSQVILNPGMLKRALGSPLLSGAVAFGIGAYALLSAAPGVLLHEKDALWLLYTFPRRVSGIIFRKAMLWAAIAVGWSLAAAIFVIARRGWISAGDVSALVWIVLGLPVYALIASSIGVLGFDPTVTEIHRRLRVDLIYLIFFLGGLLTAGLWLPTPYARAASLVAFAALAVGLWQKASARFDILLDPSAAPPRLVDAADGLIATILFLYTQGGILVLLVALAGVAPELAAFPSYAAAGAIAVGLTVLVLWRSGLPLRNLPSFFPDRPLGSLTVALLAGLGCAAVAAGYLLLIQKLGIEQARLPADWLYAALAIGAAPLFEEILFRGMVFQPLRRTLSLAPAVAFSALIFAIVHPPLSFAPVLVLGFATAFVHEKSKGLLAPMLTHAIYNAAVLSMQRFL